MGIRNILEPLYKPRHRPMYLAGAFTLRIGIFTVLSDDSLARNVGYDAIPVSALDILLALLTDLKVKGFQRNGYQNSY